MKWNKLDAEFLMVLLMVILLLPTQIAHCQSNRAVPKIKSDSTKMIVNVDEKALPTDQVIVKNESNKRSVASPEMAETTESSLSTGVIIGISTAAVVLLGGAIAVAVGGGDSSTPAAPPTPPTTEQIVGTWHADASQHGSGRTYTGTYQLYQGGGIGYNIYVSDGRHLVGNGSWQITEYRLSIRTDHGSLYKGDFAPSNITSVTLHSSNGWKLKLSR